MSTVEKLKKFSTIVFVLGIIVLLLWVISRGINKWEKDTDKVKKKEAEDAKKNDPTPESTRTVGGNKGPGGTAAPR